MPKSTFLFVLFLFAASGLSGQSIRKELTDSMVVELTNNEEIKGLFEEITEKRIRLIINGKSTKINIDEVKSCSYQGEKVTRFNEYFYKPEIESARLNVYLRGFGTKGKPVKSGFENWILGSRWRFNANPVSDYEEKVIKDIKAIHSISTKTRIYYLQKGNMTRLYQVASNEALKNCYLLSDCQNVVNKILGDEYDLSNLEEIVEAYNSCF